MKPDTIHELQKPRFDWRPWTPKGICTFEDLSMDLPLDASLAGMTLTFELPEYKADPIYLKDKAGDVLFEWRTPPSLAEVREVAQRYLR